jgi:hypothetical protein
MTSDPGKFASLAAGNPIFEYDPNSDPAGLVVLERVRKKRELDDFNASIEALKAAMAGSAPPDPGWTEEGQGESEGEGSGKGEGKGHGTGPPKTWVEELADEMSFAGGIAQLELNKEIGEGKGGMLGGQNPFGPRSLGWQFAASVVQFEEALSGAGGAKKFLQHLKNAVMGALKNRGKTLIFRQLGPDAAQAIMNNRSIRNWVAPTLANYGRRGRPRYGVIGPYDAFQEFTSNLPAYLKGRYAAHHILEQRTLKMLGQPLDKAPAIILHQAEHIGLHKRLNAIDIGASKAEIWREYQRIYMEEGFDYLLPVIAPYFR